MVAGKLGQRQSRWSVAETQLPTNYSWTWASEMYAAA